MGGAILAELAVRGCVRIDEGKKAWVEAVSGAHRVGNEILDEAFARVRESKRRRRASAWVTTFGSLKRLRHRTAVGLCRRGILRTGESQILLLFTRKAYPTLDPGPERELIAGLREAITGDSDIEPLIGVVLSILNITGALKIHFGRKELAPHKERLNEITAGKHFGTHPSRSALHAVRGAVAAAQAEVAATQVAATQVAAVAVTVSSS